MENIKEKLQNIEEITLIAENEDKTKKYMITATEDVDLRKKVFETFAKEGITIFEMKKIDATLEDAFMHLISAETEQEAEEENVNEEPVMDKKAIKEMKKEERRKKKEEKRKQKEEKKNNKEEGGEA